MSAAEGQPGLTFQRMDLSDRAAMDEIFRRGRFDAVLHLATQAGARYSLEAPHATATCTESRTHGDVGDGQ